jgi:repressor LexA
MQTREERQKEIVNFIIDFTSQNGYPPTMREIGMQIGVSSSSTVHKILHQCQKDGLIIITKGILRSMKVTDDGRELVSN